MQVCPKTQQKHCFRTLTSCTKSMLYIILRVFIKRLLVPDPLLSLFLPAVYWFHIILYGDRESEALWFITLASGEGVRASAGRSILSVGGTTSRSSNVRVSSSNSSISFRDVALTDEPIDTLAGDAGHPLSSFHCLPVRNFCGNFGLNKEYFF